MKTKLFILLITACALQVSAQTRSQVPAPFISANEIAESASEIGPLQWQVQKAADWENIVFPFFRTDIKEANLRAAFKIPAGLDSLPLALSAGGISGNLSVYLNGHLISFHPNSSAPFAVRLPAEELQKENLLSVVLKRLSDAAGGFPQFARIYSEQRYLGLKESIKLYSLPKKMLRNFNLKIETLTSVAELFYSYEIRLPESKTKYRIEEIFLPKGSKRTRYVSGGTKHIEGRLTVKKENLWSPDNPVLTRTHIKISDKNNVLFEETFQFGLRTLEIKSGGILINGVSTPIKGINYHNDAQRLKGGSYKEIIRTNFKSIKKMGFNAVRLPRYLPERAMLQMADSLGLMLFGELPILRYPPPLFFNDDLLEHSKAALSNLAALSASHPCLTAIGLGQEISLLNAATQKFMFILKDIVNIKLKTLTYVSPLPAETLPIEKIADFYMFDIYRPLHRYAIENIKNRNGFLLAGKIGCIRNEPAAEWDKDPVSQERVKFFKREFDALFNTFHLSGGFVESYMDWHLSLPNHFSIQSADSADIYPSGLLDNERRAKHWLFDFKPLWSRDSAHLLNSALPKKHSNFFSILIIFSTIIFFAVYRRMPRLNENMRKALRHPYGFFVDMRERRIIPLFNSFWVGGYAALLLSSIFSSIIYFHHDSFIMQEFSAILLAPIGLYESFLKVSSSPLYLTLILFSILLIFPVIVSFIIKITAVFSGLKIRLRQAMAVGLWSGVPLLFLMPVGLFSFQILTFESWNFYLFILIVLFVIWAHFRIINGIRVLFITKVSKVLVAILLSYTIPFIIFWAVFKPTAYWLDYLSLLVRSGSLF